MPILIVVFAELLEAAATAALVARLSALIHTMRVGTFLFRVERYLERENAFELAYKGKTYYAGIEEGGRFVVKGADGVVPEALVQELRVAADRSGGFRGLYVGGKESTRFGLSDSVTFKARW